MKDATMTGKERFLSTMNHQEPDYVPIFENLYSRKFFKEMLGYAPETLEPVAMTELAVKVGYDITTVGMGGVAGFTVSGSSDIYKDEWGVTYKRDPVSWPMDGPIEYPLKDAQDWKNYVMPDPALENRYNKVKDAIKLAGENGLGLIGNVRGPFSNSWMLFGLENFSYLLYDDPDVVDEVMTQMADFSIYGALKMLALGVPVIKFSDDYGSNLQPLISLKHFKRHIAPQIKRMCDAVHKVGGKLIMHSDGQIMPLLETIVEQGIDGVNPIQRGAGMDLAEVKTKFGKQVCILGNVDQRDLMVNGTAEEVAEQAKDCLRIAAPGGGYCLGSDHSLHDDIPTENILAIVETGRKYGKYPIKL